MENYVKKLLSEASHQQCEDIYISPKKDKYQVSLRLGEKLTLLEQLSLEEGSRLIRYFKYQAHMDVGERRLPQDGAYYYNDGKNFVELRLSTIANYLLQESLVLRLLHQNKEQKEALFTHPLQAKFSYFLRKKSGLLLFSGPVSSGKTTLIYDLLGKRYETSPCSVITMEDPVEIKDERFLQTQVNMKAGVDYGALIKASLRHHPDILVIGEIRDELTARMAIRAALTGHLVIATIHAKNCKGVLNRLKELDITPEQLLQTLGLITSQRLVPTVEGHRQLVIEAVMEKQIQPLIKNQKFENYRTLNDELEELLKHGKISQNTYEAYCLEG